MIDNNDDLGLAKTPAMPGNPERRYEKPELTHLGPIQSIVLSGLSGGGDGCCCSIGVS